MGISTTGPDVDLVKVNLTSVQYSHAQQLSFVFLMSLFFLIKDFGAKSTEADLYLIISSQAFFFTVGSISMNSP
jgi:hypothetical protein